MKARIAVLVSSLVVFCLLNVPNPITSSDSVQAAEFAQSEGFDLGRHERWIQDTPPPVSPTSDSLDVAPGLLDEAHPFVQQSPGEWTHVSFVSYRNRNWEVVGLREYSGAMNGYEAQMITNNAASDLGPKVRPVTGETAFYSNRYENYEIFVSSWNESNLLQLTYDPSYDGQPAWSPDGRRLVFVSTRDGNEELYVHDFDTGTLSRLTYSVESDFAPTFSPDGAHLVWVRAVNDREGVLVRSNTDGSNAYAFTPPLRYLQHPAYSPDGTSIAVDYDGNADGWNDLALMGADGANLRVVRSAANLTDLWVGAWATNTDLLVTYVEYVVYNQTLYIQEMGVRTYLPASDSLNFGGGHLDMNPHAVLIDISIPETHVIPLHRYERAGERNVVVATTDPGPAPLTNLTLQRRAGNTGNWEIVSEYSLEPNYSPEAQYTFPVNFPLGEVLHFRSQGVDDAGHVEPLPEGDGDTSTTIYLSTLTGSVVDNRGIRIPAASILTEPVLDDQADTDVYGEFSRYVPDRAVTVKVGHERFGVVPDTSLDTQQDAAHFWVLPPYHDLIDNGGFEAGLAASKEETCVQILGAEWAHTGRQAASLGIPLLAAKDGTVSGNASGAGYPRGVVDLQDNLHLVWSETRNAASGRHILYAERPAGGNWSAPLVIDSGSAADPTLPDLDVGEDGTVHVAWINSNTGENSVYYVRRSSAGEWSEVETAVTQTVIWSSLEYAKPQVRIDGNGTVHLLYTDQNGTHYVNRSAEGAWSAPVDFLSSSSGPALMDCSLDEQLHVLYYGGDPLRLVHRTRASNGSWMPETGVPGPLSGIVKQAILDQGGTMHVLTDKLEYLTRSASGTWSSVVDLSSAGLSHFESTMSLVEGTPYLATGTDSGIYYRSRFSEGLWSVWIPISAIPNHDINIVATSALATLFFVYGDWERSFGVGYIDLSPIPMEATCGLSKRVEIPAEMAKPTLSFVRELHAGENVGHSRLGVAIDDEVVFSATVVSPTWQLWEHQWLDLSAWAGRSVTVTLFVYNDFRHGITSIAVDDVSLGSWLSPRITGVTPNQIGVGKPATILIEGENFSDPVQVFLGNRAASSVTRLDEHKIEAYFATGAEMGLHHLRIVNATGHESIAPNAIRAGAFVFMPAIQRR